MSEETSPCCIPTSITGVCVYRSGAVVTRSGSVNAPALPAEFCVDGLPLTLVEGTVRVSATRGALVSGVQTGLALPSPGESSESDFDKTIREAGEVLSGAERALARLEVEQNLREKIPFALPRAFKDEPQPAAPTAAWRGLIDWLHESALAAASERQRLDEEITLASERLARLMRERDEARKLQSSRVDRVSKRVLFRVEGLLDGPLELQMQYQVRGAFWVPSYVFRILPNTSTAEIGVRALVAQSTGEAWERVRLSASTAELLQTNRIPELASLRIGRQHQVPERSGYREVPEGLEDLFAAVDRELARRPVRSEAVPPRPKLDMESPSHSEMEKTLSTTLVHQLPKKPVAVLPPVTVPAPAMQPLMAPPSPAASRSPFGALSDGLFGGRGVSPPQTASAKPMTKSRREAAEEFEEPADFSELSGSMEPEPAQTAEPPATVRPRDFEYASLVVDSWDTPRAQRGRLRRVTAMNQALALGLSSEETASLRRRMNESEEAMPRVVLPEGTRAVSESAGVFDYRYDSEALADIPCDGDLHNVPLLQRETGVRFEIVAVPRVSLEAFRTARIRNPLAVPLLAGPVDVYLGEEFLVRSPARTVPAGGELVLGMGIEEAVKISRNASFKENAHGMLGGGLSLVHQVELEVASRLPSSVQVEIRERIPILAEKERDIEILAIEASPPWSDFDQLPGEVIRGGKRWKLCLAPGETKKLVFSYTVRIDSKNELVGGNRRES